MIMKEIKKEEKTDKITLATNILTRLAYADTSFGVSELGRNLSKSKAYTHRLLTSLESVGWLSKDRDSQRYKVGDKLFSLALLLASRYHLSKIASLYLYELADITDETTALSVRIGYERLFVQQVPAKHDNQQMVILGQRYPLWLGATGKVMAAYLSDPEIDELLDIMKREWPTFNAPPSTFDTIQYRHTLNDIKKHGYAISVGEYIPDICVLSAPIFDRNQTVIGSLIVRGKSPRFNQERAIKYSPVITKMANNITRELQDMA